MSLNTIVKQNIETKMKHYTQITKFLLHDYAGEDFISSTASELFLFMHKISKAVYL